VCKKCGKKFCNNCFKTHECVKLIVEEKPAQTPAAKADKPESAAVNNYVKKPGEPTKYK